ncbi:hypothetical protein Tco_1404437 [Tanacetum coccineum]
MASNEETNAAGTDTRPPMLVESDYDSWKIRIHSPQPTAQSPNDALMATMTQIANLLSWFSKSSIHHTNNQLRTSSNSRTHATVHDGHIVTEPVQRKAPGNNGNTGTSPRIQRNKRNAELVQENDLLKVTLSGKEKSIAFLQSEKEKILSEKKDLADSYLDEIDADTPLHPNSTTLFVPKKELSGDQAYWLSANEIASQASKSATPATLFVRKSRPPSQVLTSLRTLMLFIFLNLDLTIEKKNLLIINECLIAECLEKDICSIVLTSDIVVPPSSNCLCDDLRSACDREHTKVLELEAEISKQKQLITESEKRTTEGSCDQQALETDRIQLKDTITSLRIQLDGLKVENVSLKRRIHAESPMTTTVSGPSTSETPKVLASGMYNLGLKHNLFSVGQFCDGGLEVAFRQHSCHIRNYDMVDLLKGSRTTNLYYPLTE